MIHILAFYLFASITILSAVFVILARNPVHSVLWLILSFFNAAGLMVLVGAEFIAMLLVIVYVGAVAVLFLFVVMMLDIKFEGDRWAFWQHFPIAAAIGAVVAAQLIAVLWIGFPNIAVQAPDMAADAPSNTAALGLLLYTEYLYPIQVAAVILLVAMVAAIALTLRQRKDSKAINPGLQVKVKASERLVVVPMAATQKAAEAAPNPEEGKA